jgi:hypothetical protein
MSQITCTLEILLARSVFVLGIDEQSHGCYAKNYHNLVGVELFKGLACLRLFTCYTPFMFAGSVSQLFSSPTVSKTHFLYIYADIPS